MSSQWLYGLPREKIGTSAPFFGFFYARLDECSKNMIRLVGRYAVVTYVVRNLLQLFLCERITTLPHATPIQAYQAPESHSRWGWKDSDISLVASRIEVDHFFLHSVSFAREVLCRGLDRVGLQLLLVKAKRAELQKSLLQPSPRPHKRERKVWLELMCALKCDRPILMRWSMPIVWALHKRFDWGSLIMSCWWLRLSHSPKEVRAWFALVTCVVCIILIHGNWQACHC